MPWRHGVALVGCLACLHCGDDGGAATDTDTDTDPTTTGGDTDGSSTGEPMLCGNGELDPGEDCDDGNLVNGDGCNADCSQSQQLAWVIAHDDGSGDDCAEGVATDADGNIIVVGFVTTAAGSEDVWIRKLDPAGEEIWTVTSDGPAGGDDRARGVATAPDGRILVTGFVTGETGQGRNLWVRALDAQGETLWTDVVDGPEGGDDQAYGAAWAGDGFVASGELWMGTNDTDVWVRKYDDAGAEVWTVTHAGNAGAPDSGRALAALEDGSLAVAGWVTDTQDGRQFFVRRLDASGATVWTKTYNAGSQNGNQANGVAMLSTGAVAATGSSRVGSDSTDIYSVLYDAEGTEVWTDTFASLMNGVDVGRGVAVGSDDQLSLVGTFRDSTADGATKMRLARFTAEGESLWTQSFSGKDYVESEGFAVATDPDDNVIIAGCQFDPMADGSGDVLVAKISP